MNADATVHSDPASSPARTAGPALCLAVLVGPMLTVYLLLQAAAHGHLSTLPVPMYLLTALLFWSPLPFSIPAVLMDNYRDAYLPNVRGIWRLGRAALLLPYLLCERSGARWATVASLTGFGAALYMSLPTLLS